MADPTTVDTGLAGLTVTAAVTEPEPETALEPETTQVPAVVPTQVPQEAAPDGWTINKTAALVREIAQNMYDLPVVLKKFGLTEGQYERIRTNKFFQKALEATVIEWNSPQNAKRRIAMESAIALEDALPDVVARLKVKTEPLPGIVALVKILSEISGLVGQQPTTNAGTGQSFKITFNLGADVDRFAKTAGTVAIQPLPQGAGPDAALQRLARPN